MPMRLFTTLRIVTDRRRAQRLALYAGGGLGGLAVTGAAGADWG